MIGPPRNWKWIIGDPPLQEEASQQAFLGFIFHSASMQDIFEDFVAGYMAQQLGVVDYFLNPEELSALRACLHSRREAGQLRLAGTGKDHLFAKDRQVRGDSIWWWNQAELEPAERRFLEQLNAFMAFLNQSCFAGIQQVELHYAVYPEGAFYERHLDCFRYDDSRKFSFVCYLNEDWATTDGGAFRAWLPEGMTELLPAGGRAVFFDSARIEHEVRPAGRERASITGWFKVAGTSF